MDQPFERTLYARWGDMDFNGHARNTSYLDMAGDVRMMYFEHRGFPMAEFERLRFGPVVLRDEIDYFRELRLLQKVRVTLLLAGLGADGSKFKLRDEFFGEDGLLVARVTSLGGWLDLRARRLAPPPASLAEALQGLARTEDFGAV